MHPGHIPAHVPGPFNDVQDCSILHYAYATPELREQKAKMYAELALHLTAQERFHGETILMNAKTKPLPFEPRWRLSIG